MMGFRSKIKSNLRIKVPWVREALAEFLGTFILILIGDGSVAQYVLSKETLGNFLALNVAWGMAVTMGVYASAGVSGGHINPAVSLAMAVMGRLPFWKFPIYMLAQYLGAIAASAIVFGVYLDALNAFDGGVRATVGETASAGVWATYPADFLTTGSGLADQIVGTAILLMCVLAITDKRNSGAPGGVAPLCVGLVVLAIGTSFGFNCGYAINPARDLGPRIFTAMAGWGSEPFTLRDHNWFWVPVVGPHIGAIVGSWIYLLCVGIHLEDDEDEEDAYIVQNTDSLKQSSPIELTGKSNNGYQEDVRF